MKSNGPIRMFPLLHRIEDFIVKSFPDLHPDSVKYTKYWADMERKCLEGMWGYDCEDGEGGWRYMPGFLFYYVNFCIIDDQDEKGNTTRKIRPMLRDVEWMMSYGWLTCRGFSGFEEDEEYTCHKLVEQIEKDGEKSLTAKQKIQLRNVKHSITKNDGTYKKYVEAREYLYQTHELPLGKPYYYNLATNFFVLGSRGFGKSFFCGNAVIGHEYNFYGKRYFDEDYLTNPAKVEIFVGSALASKSSDLLKKFSSTQEWLKKNYGSWGKGDDFLPGYFHNNSSGTLKPNAGDAAYRHEYRYREGNTWLTGGTGTIIQHGVYTVENPQAAVGTRPTVMVIEEVGLLANLMDVHSSNETCQIRNFKFGSSFYIGTGGNMEKITESKIVFEDPIAYNFLPYKDLWENRTKPIGFFLPAYYVDNDFKDELGNTDIDGAYENEMHERKIREKAATSAALDGYIMARPMVPSEMFLSATANVFPTAKLREREAKVLTENLWELTASVGELEWENEYRDSVRWKEDISRKLKPIKQLNLDSLKGNINGCIVVYEHPSEYIPNPTYRRSLYKVVYDPVKDDNGGTSLASIIVYKGFVDGFWNMGLQDAIVAEYIGRYDKVNDIHDIAIKLATYYNAKVMVENNLPDFIRYCKMEKKRHILQISPYEAISKAVKKQSAKYEMGVHMSKQLNIHCEQLIRQWLLETWKTTEDDKHLTNIDKIYSPRLLQELISYNREENFDHVSSMKLLALWLSQERLVPIDEPDAPTENSKVKSLDSFLKSRSTRIKRHQNLAFHDF